MSPACLGLYKPVYVARAVHFTTQGACTSRAELPGCLSISDLSKSIPVLSVWTSEEIDW